MRIAIVNDMALTREVLRRLVIGAGHVVPWMAVDGAEAVLLAERDPADVILMDLVMPVMDGAEATRRIMAANPCPILLVTASVTGNISKVYEAMVHGGLDAVNTPVLGPGGAIKEGKGLLDRIAKLERSRRQPLHPPAPDQPLRPKGAPCPGLPPLIVLGASTGGPDALARILGELPTGFPAALIIAQHIAAEFAPGLARWLGERTPLPVRLIAEGDAPTAGRVLVAATDDHLVVRFDLRLGYSAATGLENPYRPSVNVLFASLARHWPTPGLAVLLTGMGSDGGQGLLELRRAGWQTIAQDQASSIVYGMPRSAAELGAAELVLAPPAIAQALKSWGEASRS